MRGKKLIRNISLSILFELITIISAFLVPRLILTEFGSNTNGITQSVSQFISYISLLTAGVGAVATTALYKPMAEKDYTRISSIVNATQKFFRKISIIFVIALLVLSAIYPFFVRDEFDYLFTMSLVLILGVGTFANYYFGLAYRAIINADQRQYISKTVQIIILVLSTTASVILINVGANIHIIKLVGSLIYLGNPLFFYFYVRSHYKIDKTVAPDNSVIKQRWDAFYHQVANFVNENTDVVLLTLFTNLKEVSVYAIYFIVYGGLRTLIGSIVQGMQAAFGNMFARNEYKAIERNLRLYEFVLHFLGIVIYVGMAFLITSFVGLYTHGVTDADYHRPLFGILLSVVGFFVATRLPYISVTRAAGHFKQTKTGAILEAVINIVLSLILVIPFGMEGLIIGTLVASVFRTIQYALYTSNKLLKRDKLIIIKRYLVSALNVSTIVVIVLFLPIINPDNFLNWTINGFIITGVGIVVTTIYSLIFYKEDFNGFFGFLKRVMGFKTTKLNEIE